MSLIPEPLQVAAYLFGKPTDLHRKFDELLWSPKSFGPIEDYYDESCRTPIPGINFVFDGGYRKVFIHDSPLFGQAVLTTGSFEFFDKDGKEISELYPARNGLRVRFEYRIYLDEWVGPWSEETEKSILVKSAWKGTAAAQKILYETRSKLQTKTDIH